MLKGKIHVQIHIHTLTNTQPNFLITKSFLYYFESFDKGKLNVIIKFENVKSALENI